MANLEGVPFGTFDLVTSFNLYFVYCVKLFPVIVLSFRASFVHLFRYRASLQYTIIHPTKLFLFQLPAVREGTT